MHPAFSVIFLTTLIGVGQGLFLALFTVESYATFGLLPEQGSGYYGSGGVLALLFLAAGLIASFFHLGHPERAWRAATRWRTSWLSREVIVLPIFMGVLFLYSAAHLFGFNADLGLLPSGVPIKLTFVLGVLGTLLAFLLFLCTGMIYACLRFLREWHTPLTVINYILLGGVSGFLLATIHAALSAPVLQPFLVGWTLILLLLAFAGRVASLLRNRRLKPKSTLQSAIGVKHPKIVQKTQGAMGGSFNTREYFHGQGAPLLHSVRWLFLLLVFALPAPLLSFSLAQESGATLLLVAFALQYVGLLFERWFFFAQANHPQNLYYQSVA